MKTKEFKGIKSQSFTKANSLILNTIECSCIPFNSWFETHSRLFPIPSDLTSRKGLLFQDLSESMICFTLEERDFAKSYCHRR